MTKPKPRAGTQKTWSEAPAKLRAIVIADIISADAGWPEMAVVERLAVRALKGAAKKGKR